MNTKKPALHIRLLLVIGILLAVPLTVYLTVRFFLYTPQAAPDASIYFQPVSATMPPNSVARLLIDTQSEDLIAGRVDLVFDKNKVQLSDEVIPNGDFTNIIRVSTKDEANETGTISIVLGVGPGQNAPSGLIEFARLPFTSVTTARTSAVVTIEESTVQLVNSSVEEYNFSLGSLTFDLNPTTNIPTADTVLTLTSENPTPSLNQQFNVAVNINPGQNEVVATELYISFDPNLLRVIDVLPGSFFANPDQVEKTIDNQNGLVGYTLVILPENNTPPTQSGRVATIRMQAINTGRAEIDFTPDTIVAAINSNNQSVIKQTNGTTVDISTQPSVTITATSTPINTPTTGPTRIPTPIPCSIVKLGDINGDCKVNILDYTVWFENFGIEFDESGVPNVPLTPFGTNPDPRADLTLDGVVNTLDFVIWFENFEFSN